MVNNKKSYTPQEFIRVGMAFFLVGLFASMIADGRLIASIFERFVRDEFILNIIRGCADGFSIPVLCVSIFFNLRGLYLMSRRAIMD